MSVVSTRYGRMRIIDVDNVISRSLALYGEWALEELSLLAQIITPGMCVLDVGAFIGTHTLAFSEFTEQRGKVYSFEPRKEIYAILLENLNINERQNVIAFNMGLAEKEQILNLQSLDLNQAINFGSLALDANGVSLGANNYQVRISTIDDLGIDKIDVIKLDVEGMERRVLDGAVETILRDRPIIFCECSSLDAGSDVLGFCQGKQYDTYGFLASAYNPHNLNAIKENIFGAAKELALVLIPREKNAEALSKLTGVNLLPINNLEDLVLPLLYKPQYPFEVLAHTAPCSLLGIDFPSPALAERDGQIAGLNQAVAERDGQIAGLNQAVAERDGQIAGLNQAVAERDGQIAGLNQAVAERDDQIAGLNLVVAERDDQIAGLNLVVAERDDQIAGLNLVVAERDAQMDSLSQVYTDLDLQIKGIFNSISWRITKPIRYLRKIKGTIFWIIFSVTINFLKKPSLSPFKQFREYIFIRNNSLFDKNYYLKNNLNLFNYGINPVWHYIKAGAGEGRNPSINFNTAFYLRSYADVATSKLNPLYHYIKYGKREGRFPSEEAFLKNSLDSRNLKRQDFWTEQDWAKKKIASHLDLASGLKINELGALGRDHDIEDEILGPAVRILECIQCQHGADASFNGQRVAVLAHWDPDAVVDPYVIHYLTHFKELGWSTVLISDKAIKLTEDLIQVTDAVLHRTCPGYDFTSWKGALEYFPSLIEAEELILTNDSIFAPVGSLSPMHSAMQEIRCDFWGPAGSREYTPHLQSYYLVFRSKALHHEAFSRFWAGMQPDCDRKRAIRCETELSPWLALHGLQPAVYAPMPLLNDDITNLSHDFWRELIDIGTPFFKRELLKENARNVNINDCLDVLADAGYPIHLIANYFKRLGVTPTVPMPPRALAPEGVWPPDVRVLEIPCNPDNCAQLLPEEKEKVGNVGVFLHIYHEDLTEELVQCALCVPEPRRVYISTDTRAKEVHIRKILKLHGIESTAEVRVLPNRGWDIAPFLVGFADRIREHSILLRLHSKRSLHLSRDIGTYWRQTLFNILAGSRERTQGILRALAHNPELGMVCPPHASVWEDAVHFGGNYVRMEELLSRLGITIRPDLPIDFPMGSMFWCRRLVLEPWIEMQLRFEDFEPTLPEIRDQNLAHSIERLFFFGCGITGHRWARIPMPR